jgi:hypothetical protein
VNHHDLLGLRNQIDGLEAQIAAAYKRGFGANDKGNPRDLEAELHRLKRNYNAALDRMKLK